MKFERYTRKPVEVEAVQYEGNVLDCLKYDVRITWYGSDLENGNIKVKTAEGDELAKFGDYIVRGQMGELEVMNAEIFENTHEECRPCPRPRNKKPEADPNP